MEASLVVSIIGIIISIAIYYKTQKIDQYLNGYEIKKYCYYWLVKLDLNLLKTDKEKFVTDIKYFLIENHRKLKFYDKYLATEMKKLSLINENTSENEIIELIQNIEREFEIKLYNEKGI